MHERKFKYGRASVELIPLDDNLFAVSRLISLSRNQGQGSAVMKQVISFADDAEATLKLLVQRFGPHPQTGLDNQQLETFYERFGFVRDRGSYFPHSMTRLPSQKKHGT